MNPGTWCVDTSVAVAALDASHDGHPAAREVCLRRRPALAGHATFETLSVLTRLPGSARVDMATAVELLGRAFPERCFLNAAQQRSLVTRLPELEVVGGMVYDALVAEAARVAGRVLLTRDRRAVSTYAAIGVSFELV
jgi:predicted nucleic acid-binding protein